MFFRKKERRDENREMILRLETNLNEIRGKLSDLWENLQEEQREKEKWIRRQTESFEDLLEELQEEQTGQHAAERLLKEYELREQGLLALAVCQREQMDLLERQIQKDSSQSAEKRTAWVRQFDVMNREAQKFMRSCEMEEVGNAGEPLDYDIHEILSLVDTEDDQQAGTIAEVFCRGRFYHGSLLKKAQVAVYKKRADAGNGTGE